MGRSTRWFFYALVFAALGLSCTEAITERGLFAFVAITQMQWFGSYEPKITIGLTVLVYLIPALAYRFLARAKAAESGEKDPLPVMTERNAEGAGARRDLVRGATRSFLVAAGVFVLGAVAVFAIFERRARRLESEPIPEAELGVGEEPADGFVRLRGVERIGDVVTEKAWFDSGGQGLWHVPLVSAGAGKDDPITVLYRSRGQPRNARLPSFAPPPVPRFDGSGRRLPDPPAPSPSAAADPVESFSGELKPLSSIIRDVCERAGWNLAPSCRVLDMHSLDPADERQISRFAGGGLLVMGVFLLLLAPLRRRIVAKRLGVS